MECRGERTVAVVKDVSERRDRLSHNEVASREGGWEKKGGERERLNALTPGKKRIIPRASGKKKFKDNMNQGPNC